MSDPKFELSQKFRGLERNVWVEFIQLALEHKPLNLGQGLPDDLVPQSVLDALAEVVKCDSGDPIQQYTRGFGHPRLVQALAGVYSRLLNRAVLNPLSEVLVTTGAYEALFASIMSHVNPGDEVIVIEPFYDCYVPMVKLAGGVPKFVPLKPDGLALSSSDWRIDWNELEHAFSVKTKAIIFNNPNNPLGKVYSYEEMSKLAKLCIKHNVMCISDEVYEHITYHEDAPMIRMATMPDMWPRTITIGSAGKTFSVTGWKLGWAIGPSPLIRNCQIAHQNSVYANATPLQEAVAIAFEAELSRFGKPECYFQSLAVELKKKRDFIAGVLKDVGLDPVVPQGGYFIMARWNHLADKIDLSSEDKDQPLDYKFVKWLTKTHKLQGIPPSAFFCQEHKCIGEDFIRFCFIKKDSTLLKASEILKGLKESIP